MDRVALPEEEYEEQLEEIIRRDFYPANEKQSVKDLDEDGFPRPRFSVDEFIALHTTDEDVQFQKIMQNEEKERKERLKWIIEQSEAHNRRAAAVRDSLDQYEQVDLSGRLLGGRVAQELDALAGDGMLLSRHIPEAPIHFQPKSALAIGGETLESLTASDSKDETALVLLQQSHPFYEKAPKAIVFAANTRLHSGAISALDPPVGSINERQVWIEERRKREQKVDGILMSGGSWTPLVTTDPNILRTPILDPDDLQQPLLTWGTLASTPLRLDENNSEEPPEAKPMKVPSTEFLIPEVSDTEKTANKLHRALQERDRKKRRMQMLIKSEIKDLAGTGKQGKRHISGTPLKGASSIFEATPSRGSTLMDTPLAQALLEAQYQQGIYKENRKRKK